MGFLSSVTNTFTGNDDAKAAKKAGELGYQAAQDGVDLTSRMYDTNLERLQPYTGAGPVGLYGMSQIAKAPDNSTNRLRQIAGLNYDEVPGFQDASDAMSRQVMNNAAARGKLGSGNTLNDLFSNNAMLGDQLKNNMFNRGMATEQYQQGVKDTSFNRMATLADIGINATNNQAIMGTNAAANISNLWTGGAASQAAGIIGAQNAKNAGMNNLISLGTMAAGAFGGSAPTASASSLQPFDTSKYKGMYI